MTGVSITILGLVFLMGSISATGRPKIVGGDNAVIKHFPYLVSIRLWEEHICGGSIISDKHILTAAHCTDYFYPKNVVTVRSGTSRSDKEGITHEILAVHVHPEWNSDDITYFNDIAVLTLKNPIVFNKYQEKINLPRQNVQNYRMAYVVGWGRTSNSSWKKPEQLQKLRVALLPSDKCKPFIAREIHQEQLCSFRSVGTGPCHGDSGGPLVANGEIVGISSYIVNGNCAADIPTVYTNVFAYKDFIESVTNE